MNFEVTTIQPFINEISGREINVSILYMVNATSFGNAEKLTERYMQKKGVMGTVNAIVISNVTQVDKHSMEFLWKMKIRTLEDDLATGKQKWFSHYHLVSANLPEEAIQIIRERFNIYPCYEYSVDQSSKTPFSNIINY